MSILQEVIKNFRRIEDDTPETKLPSDSVDDENDDDLELDLPPGNDGEGDEIVDGNPEDDEHPDDISLDGEDPSAQQDIPDPNVPAGGQGGSEGGGGEAGEDDLSIGDDVEGAAEDGTGSSDPNRQGVLRTVKNAHLVYKRESGDGGFEELWIYNIGTLKDELETRKAILAGTDIPVNKTESEDGSQTYTIWSAGNAELVHVTGLQN